MDWSPAVESELIAQLPRRFTAEDTQPELLAELLRFPLAAPRATARFGAAVEQRLLDLTVHQAAANSPFYARLYQDLPRDRVIDRGVLAELPIVRRADVERAGGDIWSRATSYGFSSYTSGSTSNNPLVIDRSHEERRFIAEFLSHSTGGGGAEPTEPQVILLIASYYHGTQIEHHDGSAITLPVDLGKRTGLVLCKKLLSREFEVNGRPRRISVVAGPTGRLVHLTSWLMAEGAQDLVDSVKLVQLSGAPLTPTRLRWLAGFWRCPIADHYSLTELFVSANRCHRCGWFHFDPSGLAEVVDLESQQPLVNGRGVLLLTGFYPFEQRTPLIRYAPGDLAEVAETDCAGGVRGYRLLGRTGNVLPLDRELGPGSFLSGLEAYEALDGIADIRRRGDVVAAMEDREAARLPAFDLGRRPDGKAVVSIELRYAPSLFPERAAAVRGEVAAAMAKVAPAVAPLLDRGELTVELFAPDATPRSYRTHLREQFPSQGEEPEPPAETTLK